MIIKFSELNSIPKAVLDQVIEEFIISQIEDSNIEDFTKERIKALVPEVKSLLKKGDLIATFCKKNNSIRIKSK